MFTGGYVENPATGKQVPIWIADYVLSTYGYGAVMAVPAHDERDFVFAKKYDLPIVCVVQPTKEAFAASGEDGTFEEVFADTINGQRAWPHEGVLQNSTSDAIAIDGLSSEEARERINSWLEAADYGKKEVQYKLRDWLFSRQRYWGEPIPVVHFEDGTKRILGVDELPLCPPDVQDFKPAGDGRSPLAKVDDWVTISDSKTGKKAVRDTNTMQQ